MLHILGLLVLMYRGLRHESCTLKQMTNRVKLACVQAPPFVLSAHEAISGGESATCTRPLFRYRLFGIW